MCMFSFFGFSGSLEEFFLKDDFLSPVAALTDFDNLVIWWECQAKICNISDAKQLW